MATAQDADVLQAIEAWRARGADRVAPVRFKLIEAMARRAQACEGTARKVIEDKLSVLLAEQVEAFEQQAAPTATAAGVTSRPLAHLVSLLDALHPTAPAEPAPSSAAARPAAAVAKPAVKPTELKAVKQFRNTWRRLHTDQRLNQALAEAPQNAGPLNSHRLIHRTLTLMREVSPEYLERFVAYVDALGWLDDVAGAGAAPKTAKAPKAPKVSKARP